MKELAVIGVKGVNLEKPVGRARTVVFDKKYVPNSNMEGVMELGEKLVHYGIKFTNTFSVHQRNKNPCEHMPLFYL